MLKLSIAGFLFCGVLPNLALANPAPERRLTELGIQLSPIPAPIGNYAHFVRSGNVLYLTGKGPVRPSGGYVLGKVGRELNLAQAQEAARLTLIHQLAVLKSALGSLDQVDQILKVTVIVNSSDEFTDHPKVADGASNLLTDVFGEKGKHARTAFGVNSLPFGIPVEIELVVRVRD